MALTGTPVAVGEQSVLSGATTTVKSSNSNSAASPATTAAAVLESPYFWVGILVAAALASVFVVSGRRGHAQTS